MANPKTIDSYNNMFPKDIAKRLQTITEIVRTKAKDAEEKIGYGMPAFMLNGRLLYYSAFKNHIGFYPLPSAIREFKEELKKYKTATGSVQFPHDKPLPVALIKKIVTFRVKEQKEKVKKVK